MDENDKAAALAEMRERRINSIRERARRDVALQLLEEHGAVSLVDVEAAVSDVEIDRQSLADQMAAKALAGVDFQIQVLESARGALDGVRAKVNKYKDLATAAKAELEGAQTEVAAAEQGLLDARELAEYAAGLGDASAAPAPSKTSAKAGNSAGKAGV